MVVPLSKSACIALTSASWRSSGPTTTVVEIVRMSDKHTQMFGDIMANFTSKLGSYQRHKGRNSTTVHLSIQKLPADELNKIGSSVSAAKI